MGDYVLTWSANISEVPNLSTSSSVNFSVDVIFENITVMSSDNDIIIGVGPEMINISCSVQASVEPSFEFFHNGMRMGIQTFLIQSGNLYQSSFILNSNELIVGTENFMCTSRFELGGAFFPSTHGIRLDQRDCNFYKHLSVAVSQQHRYQNGT